MQQEDGLDRVIYRDVAFDLQSEISLQLHLGLLMDLADWEDTGPPPYRPYRQLESIDDHKIMSDLGKLNAAPWEN